jgi:CheY-like chemotaxis protein/GAF domain-containing protein
VAKKPRILFVGNEDDPPLDAADPLRDLYQLVEVTTAEQALTQLSQGDYCGLFFAAQGELSTELLLRIVQAHLVLGGMPDGVLLLDRDKNIVWTNQQFQRWSVMEDAIGNNIYRCLGNPEILGPDFCPCHTAWETGRPCQSVLQIDEDQFFQLHAAPLLSEGGEISHLIVAVQDVTEQQQQQQKLSAIHHAGGGLADLTSEEVFQMSVEDRIQLLKENIRHYTQHVLNYDYVEIRLLDQKSGTLMPLLSAGIDKVAAERALYAQMEDNGVTGFVAATGKSYLCENTQGDPLYLPSFKDAQSSLTVPLLSHDQVIGTFDVESPEPRAFDESDRQFLELFARDVALAIHTLELLVVQKATAAQESVEAIHGAVALPVDHILNAAVFVLERYIGHEPAVVDRLKRILRNARDIKQVIQKVGRTLTPAEALPEGVQIQHRPKLEQKRILVVDADESARNDAHALLARYGCVVETAEAGDEAIYLVRNAGGSDAYDVIIADILLSDMGGYELLLKLRDLDPQVRLILMTGFGYDPGHSIVKARQDGLDPNAVLYKPFRLDQLLDTVEMVITGRDEGQES